MTTNPPEVRIRNLLKANAGVSAIVGTDIYYPYFPADAVLPGIIFFENDDVSGGGKSLSNIGLRNITIQTQCYASNVGGSASGARKARTLHEAVRTAFLGDFTDDVAHIALLRDTFAISLIQEEQEGQPLPVDPDGPDKGTPVRLGFWTIWFLD